MKTYLKQASPAEREALANAVESSVGYLYLIGGGHRRASSGLCQKLVAAESKLSLPELRPDIWGESKVDSNVARRATDPEPLPGRAGRTPVSRDRIMTTSIEQPPRLLVPKK